MKTMRSNRTEADSPPMIAAINIPTLPCGNPRLRRSNVEFVLVVRTVVEIPGSGISIVYIILEFMDQTLDRRVAPCTLVRVI